MAAPTISARDLNAVRAALDHARGMVISQADLRMRNFNFYTVITGALAAAYASKTISPGWVIAIAGTLASVMFFGLDVRGYGLHQRSVNQLAILEPLVWEQAGVPGWTPIPRTSIASHKWIYRTFFAITGCAWVAAFAAGLLR
jgi:hypothetical protein